MDSKFYIRSQPSFTMNLNRVFLYNLNQQKTEFFKQKNMLFLAHHGMDSSIGQ